MRVMPAPTFATIVWTARRSARACRLFQPQWTVRKGVEQVYEALCHHGTSAEEFLSSQFIRLKRIRELQATGALDEMLRWRVTESPASVPSCTAA